MHGHNTHTAAYTTHCSPAMIEFHALVTALSAKRGSAVVVSHPLERDVDTRLVYLLTKLALQFLNTFSAAAATITNNSVYHRSNTTP